MDGWWCDDSHATPHSPNPELRSTEPLWTSATASSALLKILESPRLTVGAATDLQRLDCEKLRSFPALHLNADGAPRHLLSTLAAVHRGALAANTGAERPSMRETVAIVLFVVCLNWTRYNGNPRLEIFPLKF